jgi:hypothetical protein
MCMFSQAVEHVGSTRMFARATRRGTQMLVYSMNVRASAPVAMILPLPVPSHPPNDAVRFIDLSAYPKLFDDLRAAFPATFLLGASRSQGAALSFGEAPKLVVHQVGSFEASFVPCVADFGRLDERFRLSPEVWEKLPQYRDWGFAVFQLKPGDQTVHPMALEFPRRDPSALFFPTVHVHDGAMHAKADFDHDLYCQAGGILGATLDWTTSLGPLGAHVEELKARGVVRAEHGGFTQAINGRHDNRDIIVRTPDIAWSGGDVVSAHGPEWVVRVHGRYASKDPNMIPEASVIPARAWCETARRKLDGVFAALRDGVPALVAEHGAEWGLAPYLGEIPSFWPSRYPATQRAGAFVLMGEIYTPHVEHQEVAFSFTAAPPRETELAIERAVRKLLHEL